MIRPYTVELEIDLVLLMTDMPKPKLIQFSAGYVMCYRYLKTEPLFSSTLNAHFRSTLVALWIWEKLTISLPILVLMRKSGSPLRTDL